jgi:hypothetical protein
VVVDAMAAISGAARNPMPDAIGSAARLQVAWACGVLWFHRFYQA